MIERQMIGYISGRKTDSVPFLKVFDFAFSFHHILSQSLFSLQKLFFLAVLCLKYRLFHRGIKALLPLVWSLICIMSDLIESCFSIKFFRSTHEQKTILSLNSICPACHPLQSSILKYSQSHTTPLRNCLLLYQHIHHSLQVLHVALEHILIFLTR